MTTEYDTEEQAMNMGVFYAGYRKDEIEEVIKNAEITEQQMANILYSTLPKEDQEKLSGLVKKVKIFTFPTKEGKKFSIGIGKFREGYDLWLIDPETGMSLRT